MLDNFTFGSNNKRNQHKAVSEQAPKSKLHWQKQHKYDVSLIADDDIFILHIYKSMQAAAKNYYQM